MSYFQVLDLILDYFLHFFDLNDRFFINIPNNLFDLDGPSPALISQLCHFTLQL